MTDVTTKTAPERIWLQVDAGALYDNRGDPFPEYHAGITWCDMSVGGVAVEYVRADIAQESLADTQRAIIEAAERRGYERALAEVASMRADAERYRFEAAFRTTFNATKKTTGERYEQ